MSQKIIDLAVELVSTFGTSLAEDPERLGQLLEDKCSDASEDIFYLTFALKEMMRSGSCPSSKMLKSNVGSIKERLTDRLGFDQDVADEVFDGIVRIAEAAESADLENGASSRIEARRGFVTVFDDIASRPRTAPTRKRAIRNGLLLIAIVMVFLGFYVKAMETRYWIEGQYTVMFMSHLSGADAERGHVRLKSAQMSADAINRAGGIKGKYLRLLVRDMPRDPEEAEAAFAEAARGSVITSVISMCDDAVSARLARASDRLEIPMILAASTSTSAVMTDGRPYLYPFRLNYDDDHAGRALGYFAAHGLKRRDAAIAHLADDESAIIGADSAASSFEQAGGTADVRVSYTRRAGLDDASVSALLSSGADCLLMIDSSSVKDDVIVKIREAGYNGVIAVSCQDAIWTGRDRRLPDGIWWLTPASEEDAQLMSIIAEYSDKYNERIPGDDISGAVLAYDALRWTADALARAPGYQGEALRHAFLSTRNLPLAHATLSVDPRTHGPLNKAISLQYSQGGKIKHQRRFRPQI